MKRSLKRAIAIVTYLLLVFAAAFSLSYPYAIEPSYPFGAKRIPPPCETFDAATYTPARIREILDDPEGWEDRGVIVSGDWSWLEHKSFYILRDGADVIPLKHWQCSAGGDFGGTPIYAEMRGVVVVTDGRPFIVIDEIRLPKPPGVQLATVVGGASLALLILLPVIALLRRARHRDNTS